MFASRQVSSIASPARAAQRLLALCLICTLLLGPWSGLVQGAWEPAPTPPAEAAAAMPCHSVPDGVSDAPPAAADGECCDGVCWHCALCGPAPAVPPSLSWRAVAAHQVSTPPPGMGRITRGLPDNPYRPPSPISA